MKCFLFPGLSGYSRRPFSFCVSGLVYIQCFSTFTEIEFTYDQMYTRKVCGSVVVV